MNINALSAATSVIIPIQCEFFALEGLAQLLNTVRLIRKTINPKLMVKGFLPTMYSAQNNLSKQVFSDLTQHFENKLFKDMKRDYIVIPRNVKLAESPSFGKPAILYDITSAGSKAYQNLAQAILVG
jgi:chromosome partitioning protein